MQNVIREALREGRDVLLEHELLDALDALGVPTPARRLIPVDKLSGPQLTAALEGFNPARAVIKVVSPQILHKSDVGGVKLIRDFSPEAVAKVGQGILDGLPAELREGVLGLLVEEAVDFESRIGHELLVGMRNTPDFGPVYTVGFGGTYVEALAAATKTDQATILTKPGLTSEARLGEKLQGSLFFRWGTGQIRGVDALCPPAKLRADLQQLINALELIRAAVEAEGRSLEELELNPLVWATGDNDQGGRWVPVDALGRLGGEAPVQRAFPVENLRRGIRPEAVALIGVSTKMNMGRIILGSVLEAGFDKERCYVVREGTETIDGVRCVPNIAALPEVVDMLVLAVPAPAVPEVLEQVYQSGKVRAVLLIPGGMGETEGGKGIAEQVEALVTSQQGNQDRAVLIGNNSVGVVSRRVKLDTLFIPKEKLPRRADGLGNIAFISQSGAFMLTQMGKLDFAAPDYQLSVGNQIDARVSHFVEALCEEPDLTTFALYVEGLKPGDGVALARAIERLRAAGKDAIVYKAGRSGLGQAATMGHTASVAGDFRVFADLLTDAGAIVVETFEDFCELVRLSATLGPRGCSYTGRRAAMTSNAGYETVGMADAYRGEGYALDGARFSEATTTRIAEALSAARIDKLVTVSNPLDLTPMANDEVHATCIEAILDDDGVDLGVFGMVPFTPAVQSLPKGLSERDVFDAEHGFCTRMIALAKRTSKPFAVVVDGGSHYDPMCAYLQEGGVPVFREGDRAIRAVGRYVESRLPPLDRR
jgi:acyl-CoA synthetase (NDP forming)